MLAAALSQASCYGQRKVVDRVAAGGRWHCVDGCGCSGVIDDPVGVAVGDGGGGPARRSDLQAVIMKPCALRRAPLR